MSTVAGLSAVLGFFFGLTSFFILYFTGTEDAGMLALLSGLGFTLILWPILVLYNKVIDKRYAKIEKEITLPVLLKTNGNFDLGGGKIKNGNIYLCESGFICLCLEEKPYSLDEILFQDIEYYQFDDFHLNIIAKDGRMFVITSDDVPKILDVLREMEHI